MPSFVGYLMPDLSLKNNNNVSVSSAVWVQKGVYTFAEYIYSKVNVEVRLEFEHTDYDVAVQLFNQHDTETPSFLTMARITGSWSKIWNDLNIFFCLMNLIFEEKKNTR